MLTWIYQHTAAHINMVLRPFGLILMSEWEGDPPQRPCTVQRVWIQRRDSIGMWS